MKTKIFYKLFLCTLAIASVMSSCKHKRKAQQTAGNVQNNNTVVAADTTNDKCKLDYKSGKTLTRLMHAQELDYKTVTAKFNCELNMNNEDESFNVSVRSRKDSVIWLNVSKIGVDALRMLITKDSVKFMIMTNLGGLDKSYFAGDFAYINQQLNADLDFDVIQALLFGNSAEYITDSVRLKGSKDKSNCQYLLSTIRKKKVNKILEGGTPKESAQMMWLNPETFKIMMLEYDDAETQRKFTACYDDFQKVGDFMAPFKLLYIIKSEKTVKADIKYAYIKLNEDISFPYKVPHTYPKIKLENNKPKNNPGDH